MILPVPQTGGVLLSQHSTRSNKSKRRLQSKTSEQVAMKTESADGMPLDCVIEFTTPVVSWFYLLVILLISITS